MLIESKVKQFAYLQNLFDNIQYMSASPTKTVENQRHLIQCFRLISLSQEPVGIENYFQQIVKPSNQNFVQISDAKTISEEHWLQLVLWMLAHISICTVAMPRSLGCMPKYWIYGLIQSKLFVGVSMVLPVINKVEC